MALLQVEHLCKRYESFALDDVSFDLEPGYIMGFIGRNGAGKSTTIKSILRLVHPDSGHVEMFGMDFAENEARCKQELGVVLGQVNYYPRQKLDTIADVTRRFYSNWDAAEYRRCLERFELDPQKRIYQLSAGMKVKFALTLALSHHARLLLLDEPTSGLDPVSRDDLLDLFRDLVYDGERSILFSTHVTSDLDKCADYITYIRDGRIFANTDRESFLDAYRIIRGTRGQMDALSDLLIGIKADAFGFTALIRKKDLPRLGSDISVAIPNLEDIMIRFEKEEAQ